MEPLEEMDSPVSPNSFLGVSLDQKLNGTYDGRPATAEPFNDGGGMEGPSRIFNSPSFMGASMMSSTDSRWKNRSRGQSRSRYSQEGRCLSAPLLPASASAQASTWYTSSTGTGGASTRGHSFWKPLASSWRDWDSDEFGPVRKNVDDGSAFRDGCVPHWGKGCNVRKHSALEHELAFAYYRMRRHVQHPHRKEIGDPALPAESVVVEMRNGRNKQFHFWRDLRPPFQVLEARRLPDAPGAGNHPDGDLHEVIFECPIDYAAERLWNTKSDSGTFSNKVHSTAMLRIPDAFPRKRPLVILTWGQPKLNWSPGDEVDNDGNPLRPVMIDPSKWMPISDELKERADMPRFAKCRAATKASDSLRGIQTKPLQKLLLGRHPSLAKLAGVDRNLAGMTPKSREAAALRIVEESGGFPPKKIKPRQHRIFTAAAGFVRYAG